ncbi:hypothetical protein E6C27_scaffold120G001100 [Cucumis melo var. makuwa]|uniref:Uncharacterized protein n=1 Tax=Cucumis melo var. makuwa TaxID=1194695 RepID=A0A5A7UBH4_CUCMM|nr:hypothetical protein E6C27_scaffold120G001100 [Cucumis melo var. makuwa]
MPFPRRRFADSSFAIAMDSTVLAALHIIQFTVILELHAEKFVSWWLYMYKHSLALHGIAILPRLGMFLDLLPLAKAWNVRVPEIAESHKTVPHTEHSRSSIVESILALFRLNVQHLARLFDFFQILRESPELLDFSLLFGCDEIVVRLI